MDITKQNFRSGRRGVSAAAARQPRCPATRAGAHVAGRSAPCHRKCRQLYKTKAPFAPCARKKNGRHARWEGCETTTTKTFVLGRGQQVRTRRVGAAAGRRGRCMGPPVHATRLWCYSTSRSLGPRPLEKKGGAFMYPQAQKRPHKLQFQTETDKANRLHTGRPLPYITNAEVINAASADVASSRSACTPPSPTYVQILHGPQLAKIADL